MGILAVGTKALHSIRRVPQSSLKKNLNASRPSEHPPVRGGEVSKRLGGVIGCKDETTSWHVFIVVDSNLNHIVLATE